MSHYGDTHHQPRRELSMAIAKCTLASAFRDTQLISGPDHMAFADEQSPGYRTLLQRFRMGEGVATSIHPERQLGNARPQVSNDGFARNGHLPFGHQRTHALRQVDVDP